MTIFIKRFGVLKTGDMMKMAEKLGINKKLTELLAANQAKAKAFQSVESLSKSALRKLSSATDDINIEYSGYTGYKDAQGISILKILKLNEKNDLFLKIVRYALGYQTAEVISAPKSRRNDINKLYAAARNEKRKIKSYQTKILEKLEKIAKIRKKIGIIVDRIKGDEMIKGLWFDDYKGDVHRASPNFNKLKRYKKECENLVSKMRLLKNDATELLKQCGFRQNEIDIDITHATYTIADLRNKRKEMQEKAQV